MEKAGCSEWDKFGSPLIAEDDVSELLRFPVY